MDISDILIIGDKVDLDIDNNIYRTLVEDIPTEETFLVSEITDGNRRIRIEPGEELDVFYYRQDAMYIFSAMLKDRIDEGLLELLQFEVTSEPMRHQRRDSFRLQMSLPVDVWRFDETVGGELDTYKFTGASMDLSETGMLLMTHENVKPGTAVNCEIQLSRQQKVSVRAEAMRVEQPAYRDQPYHVGLKFIGASEPFRRLILKYILQEQMKAKRPI